MARSTVVGGTGYAGPTIAATAASRGHAVTSWSRWLPEQQVDRVTFRTGDVSNDDVLARVVQDTDTLVTALSPRGNRAAEGGPGMYGTEGSHRRPPTPPTATETPCPTTPSS